MRFSGELFLLDDQSKRPRENRRQDDERRAANETEGRQYDSSRIMGGVRGMRRNRAAQLAGLRRSTIIAMVGWCWQMFAYVSDEGRAEQEKNQGIWEELVQKEAVFFPFFNLLATRYDDNKKHEKDAS